MGKYWIDAKSVALNSVSYNHTPSLMAKSAFFYMQSVGHFRCEPGYYTKREGYRSYLLLYTVSGKGYARYRDREYELKAGQVLLMDCYDYQEYYPDQDSIWEIKWLHFFGSTSQEYFNIIFDKNGAVIEIMDRSNVQYLLDEILMMAEESDFLPEARVSLLILQLITELLLEGGESGVNYNARVVNEHVKLALDFVEENYNNSITLSDMASHSCCSEYHFSRLFKKITGYSPYEYIVKYRVNKAKNLLKNTDKSVEDISECIGFGSPSNFIRTFRELEGMTPLKYRKYWG